MGVRKNLLQFPGIEVGGELKQRYVIGAVATATVQARPDEGKWWIVQDCTVHHDDNGGAHTLNFQWRTGDGSYNRQAVSKTTGAFLSWFANDGGKTSFIVTRDCWIGAISADAIPAGKYMYITINYIEFELW